MLGSLSYAPRPVRRVASQVFASPRVSNLTDGGPVERAYPVVPLSPRHGVSIGMTTVAGQACFGIYAQVGLAADADRLAEEIDVAIDELLILCDEQPT